MPGSVSEPEFEGFKIGHFSRKQKGLVIMIAVPKDVADGAGLKEFLGMSLREAVRLAAPFFTSKGISFSTPKAERVIFAIENGIR